MEWRDRDAQEGLGGGETIQVRYKLIRKRRQGHRCPSSAKPVIFLSLVKCHCHQAGHLKFLTAFTSSSCPKAKAHDRLFTELVTPS